MDDRSRFHKLIEYLSDVPSVQSNASPSRGFGCGEEKGVWWVKFSLDIDHPLAWSVVQEFGHVLNSLSLEDRLPTAFKPVSPPSYLNGGPRDYLSWVIECPIDLMNPDTVTEWLINRLPQPVNDPSQWDCDE